MLILASGSQALGQRDIDLDVKKNAWLPGFDVQRLNVQRMLKLEKFRRVEVGLNARPKDMGVKVWDIPVAPARPFVVPAKRIVVEGRVAQVRNFPMSLTYEIEEINGNLRLRLKQSDELFSQASRDAIRSYYASQCETFVSRMRTTGVDEKQIEKLQLAASRMARDTVRELEGFFAECEEEPDRLKVRKVVQGFNEYSHSLMKGIKEDGCFFQEVFRSVIDKEDDWKRQRLTLILNKYEQFLRRIPERRYALLDTVFDFPRPIDLSQLVSLPLKMVQVLEQQLLDMHKSNGNDPMLLLDDGYCRRLVLGIDASKSGISNMHLDILRELATENF